MVDGREKARHILIVDDNEDAAEALAVLLRLRGHLVDVAREGQAALQRVAASSPDAVLLDIGLPGQDGYDVARIRRGYPRMETALVVAITGYAGDDVQARAKAARFDRCLTKPVDIEVVAKLVEGGVSSRP
jgi:two-component system CheB/CheR fusion protein